MRGVGLVRPSREGDQFHYDWAARQCLRLLAGEADLVAVTVEGASVDESPDAPLEAGEEVIDVGLYHGTERIDDASMIRYVQLKHSTVRVRDPWTASGLKNTIRGFADRYAELADRCSEADVAARFRFSFVTNRPIASPVAGALSDLGAGTTVTDSNLIDQLFGYTDLARPRAEAFFRLFTVESSVEGLWLQRNLLAEDLRAYLPDADYDAPVQIRELVTEKALAKAAKDPSIRRHDVLRALRVDEPDLFPALNLVKGATEAFARAQEDAIRNRVFAGPSPIVIHADGGVGKSILAARLAASMPTGSVAVHYDCFGDGLYRSAHNFRHRPRDAFVQIANELAAKGLCHPLIPSAHADVKAYLKAFTHRLAQASAVLTAADPAAVLCLIIDAADNAELAARADGEASSFARHLLHAPMPCAVRLVLTSRSHRRHTLQVPPGTTEILLNPFTWEEAAQHLRTRYPEATDAEIEEFNYVSSANPRVQALAMDMKRPLPEMLQALGPTPTTIAAAIGELLSTAINSLKARSDHVEAEQIDDICRGLAVLRPLVPIPVLAALTGVDPGAIRTFAYDLGRPLSIRGESLHFLDEPAETWFRETFAPDAENLARFLERLRPLAASSAYVASVLPYLLLEAGRRQELVDLALSSEALPTANPLERRDVELRRLTFALKASLRQRSYMAAAKLALKAAGESAGEDRQKDLLQANIHLAGALLEPDRVLELVSRRTFGSGWMGSHHAYDAAILSGREDLASEAVSRLRMALDWLMAWAREARAKAEDDRNPREAVSDSDRAAIALAELRLRGAERAAHFLRSWTPRPLAFAAGRLLADQLVDLAEYNQLDELALAARNNVWLLLALACSARAAGRSLPPPALSRLLHLLTYRRLKVDESNGWDRRFEMLAAVTDAVELALETLPQEPARWAELLRRYLPDTPPNELTTRFRTDRRTILRPYVLEAALRGAALTIVDVAPNSIRKEVEGVGHSYGRSSEGEFFRLEVGGLLPWMTLAAERLCGRCSGDLSADIAKALSVSDAAMRQSGRETHVLHNDIAITWLSLLADAGATTKDFLDAFLSWKGKVTSSLWPNTLISLCRRAARKPGLENLAIDLGTEAGAIFHASREQAESRTASYLQLARAVFAASLDEARAYFDQGMAIADRVGEENVDRWTALLRLAHAAAAADHRLPETAYRLSRVAALVYEYVARDKYFDWDTTVAALARLCPSSALAILSRWRDRQFGSKGRVLGVAITQLIEDGQLPPRAKIALSGIEAEWNRPVALKSFLASPETVPRRRRGSEIAFRYIRVLGYEVETLRGLADIAEAEKADFPDLDRMIAFKTKPVQPKAAPELSPGSPGEPIVRRTPDWDELFDGVDLTNSSALLAAYRRLRTYDPPYELDAFYVQSAARVKAGSEAAWLRAIGEWPEFGPYDLERVLKLTPPAWRGRLAFKTAIREVLLGLCGREPGRIGFSRYNHYRPFEALFAEGVVDTADAVEACLAGYAEQAELLDAGGLFQLLEPLAERLTPAEADEALHFGLDLLEPTLTLNDGDGPWRAELAPVGGALEGLAGYIWAGLSSPKASERWEFAHVIRDLVELDWHELLSAIAALTDIGQGGPFVDQGLPFYSWHARQWLAIGLARGGRDCPAALPPFVGWLERQIESEHVLLRAFAAEALAAWATTPGGALIDRERLVRINCSPFPIKEYRGWQFRADDDVEDTSDEAGATSEDDRYYFGIDIGPCWLAPLGRVFGLSQSAAERRTMKVLRETIGWRGGGWRDDTRRNRRVFEEGETMHSHGSMPRTDDLTAYHAYHAMMLTAGVLLSERPVGRSADAEKDAFQDWLAEHHLSRPDGRWLIDRVDPALVDQAGSEGGHSAMWPWQIGTVGLDAQLATSDGAVVLWGSWSSGHNDKQQTVTVRSSLVTEAAAPALLAALQTAKDLMSERLPDAEQDSATVLSSGVLSGWVIDEGLPQRLDEFDPWAGRVRFPAAAPNSHTISALGLTGNLDGRHWRGASGQALRSDSWTTQEGYGRESEAVSHTRLSSNLAFVRALLAANPGTVLILSVSVRRQPPSYEVRSKELEPYPWPYVRYYLMGFDGVATPL